MRCRRLRGWDREEYLAVRDEAIDDFLVAGRRLFDMLDALGGVGLGQRQCS